MAFGHLALHQPGMGLHVLADDEEGRGHMLVLEDVEDLRRPVRVGAVVEGQRHLLGDGADAADHVVGRKAV